MNYYPDESTNEAPNRPAFTFKDPQAAFVQAIASGRLSAHPTEVNYAGKYMYMGTQGSKDMFKHINTREYIS